MDASYPCIDDVVPSPEVCDGLDNDCDGVVDNGALEGGQPCVVPGQFGVCAQGASTCVNGQLVCAQVMFPSAEQCDGLDNDCDGAVDDGDPGAWQPCVVPGQFGVCAKGATKCVNGQLVCAQLVQPSPEACDALDNDCNNVVDDNPPALCPGISVCYNGTCPIVMCITCGAPPCPPCELGAPCMKDAECASGMCHAGKCVASINGCDVMTAVEKTTVPSVAITFPGPGLVFSPACVKVKAGTNVTFSGDFSLYPLEGGHVENGAVIPAAAGPFVPATNAGTSKTFTMGKAGTFPYVSPAHANAGMIGAVFVVP
ncbi:hypothetical protein E8A74_14365 [Polyangium fumosum]|uniref:Blue (type 1) copper domain-containing protein n=1 Tax=Polyangium fumosum TaxID=889272 RepID=A0A4U1JDP7_9BACT|nr:hypothetical protein E8A74_14365 [Polyangium fumosum]